MSGAAQYKIVLIGNAGVGKSSFYQRLRLGESFDSATVNVETIGVDCFDYKCTIENASVKVALHDTAGNERYRSTMTSNYFRRTQGVILMYSVDDQKSFEDVHDWKTTASLYTEQDVVWALVGNKCDLYSEVPENMVTAICNEFHTNMSFMVSAKTGQGVKEAFEKIIEKVHNQQCCCTKPPAERQLSATKVVGTKQKSNCC